ncbi:MAG: hypothetical protein JXQ96_18945 [Cyclobacteriaceae bacterium]
MKYFFITPLVLLLVFNAAAQRVELLPDSLMKKSVIKMEFFSPLSGNTTIGYERYIKNFTSFEAKVGFIGLGKQFHDFRDVGIFVKAGPKFKLKPSYATEGTFGTHLLKGSYIRPELAFSVFSHDEYERRYDQTITSFAILINYGKQHVLGRIMTLDWHVGLGYGFSNDDEQSYYYGYTAGGNDFPLAFSAGFTLGFLLK